MWQISSIKELTIELTSHCNAKCPQCGRFNIFGEVLKDLQIQNLNLDMIKKLPTEKMTNLEKIIFNGNYGEPLMHPNIDEILERFKDKKIIISTNGSIRSIEWWKKLSNFKNIQVIFGIDGLENTHHLYRRNTNFKKIIQNAEAFINNGGQAEWQYIIFKHNENQIDEAKKLAKSMGFQKIFFRYSDRFLKNNKSDVYDENKELLYVLEPTRTQKTIYEYSEATKDTFYTKRLFKIKNIDKNISCPWAKDKKIFISHTGLVLPCCHMASIQAGKPIYKKLFEKIIESYEYINLNNYSFDEIINSSIFQILIPESIKSKPHPNCIEHCSPILSKNKIVNNERKILNNLE